MRTDGWVTIGFKGNSKQLDRDLRTAEAKLKKFETESEKLATTKIKAEQDLEPYREEIRLIEEGLNGELRLARTAEEKNNVIRINQKLLDEVNQKYSTQIEALNTVNKKIAENAHNQQLVKTEIRKANKELGKVKGLNDIKGHIDNIGNSISRTVKKIARWGLAIFGIRSAYLAVRAAMSTLSQYDDQLSTDIEYIRYALATLLKPVVEAIVDLAYKFLAYIGYIAKAWFNVNIFANATAKGFQNADKSAKKLSKTLAGFDEMNVLNEDGSVGVAGVPSMDLSNLDNVEIPKWIKWIAENKDKVLGFFDNLLEIILAFKLAQWAIHLAQIFGLLQGLSGLAIFGMLAGIAITIYGIFETIQAVIEFIKDPSWENFMGIIEGLSIALTGLGIAMVAFNASNPIGWITLAVGAVGTIISAFVDWGDEAEDTARELEDTKQATDNLREAQEQLAEQTETYTNAVKNAEKAQADLEKIEKDTGISGEKLFKQVQMGTLKYKDMDETQRQVFDAYVKNKEATDKLEKATKDFADAQEHANVASGKLSGSVYQETGVMDDYFTQLMEGYRNGAVEGKTFYKAFNGMLLNMDADTKKTFVEGLPEDVQKGVKEAGLKYGLLPGLVSAQMILVQNESKKAGSGIIQGLDENINENKISSIFSRITNTWKSVVSGNLNANLNFSATGKKGSGRAKGGIFYPSKLPKLAVGGIINRPGRGVPYNGAIIGERGAEAVVPLTDSQQMALLGETIGKYITVDLTNITNLDGRQIARKVEQINQNDRFVLNR